MGVSLEKIDKWEKKKKTKKLMRVINTNGSVEIRTKAIRALSSIEEPDIVNLLTSLTRDPEPQIRLASIQALGIIGSERAVEFIRAAVEKETDQRIIEEAKLALTSIKEKMAQEEKV